MKILAANILYHDVENEESEPVILSKAEDLSSFSMFHRGGIREFATFISRTLSKRTPIGVRQQINHSDQYLCYCQKRSNGICGVLITDFEYKSRIAFDALYKMIIDFEKAKYEELKELIKGKKITDECLYHKNIQNILSQYQDPTKVDNLSQAKKDLEETKTIMNQALENVLKKGEKLENLVDKSNDLSLASKTFYDTSADQNSCCSIQ